MNLRKFLIFSALFTFYFLLFTFAFAQQTASPSDDFLGIELTIDKIANIITGFACWLINIVLAIMVIVLIFAGIRFFRATKLITDGGKTTEINEAKKNFQWVLVGILVILATNVIIATIANALGGNYSFVPLQCGQTQTQTPIQQR